jgi:hypothetical protein
MICEAVSVAIWHLPQIGLSVEEPVYYRALFDLLPLQISCGPYYFHKNQRIKVTTNRAPYGWKAYVGRGAALCPEGIVFNTAVTTSVPCSLHHDGSLILDLVDQSPVCHPRMLPPTHL